MATMINRPLPARAKPALLELYRRMLAVRADDARRVLAVGESRHKKSTKALSPSRVEREFAVIRAALNDAVPRLLMVSPAEGVGLPRAATGSDRWHGPARGRGSASRSARRQRRRRRRRNVLTTVKRQALWAAGDLRPCPVMVWMPDHTGAVPRRDQRERLFALFCLDDVLRAAARRGDRPGLGRGRPGSRARAGAGDRRRRRPEERIRVPGGAAARRGGRRAAGMAEDSARRAAAWGEAWTDTGRVFTREDGTAVPGQWASVRFETLAYRAGLPPVRFHDLRHGAASVLKAAGLDTKLISAFLGHSRTSFTDATYVLVFPDVAAGGHGPGRAAVVPRKLARDS